jgi:DNA-binding MarR family transcriptional regulator
MSDVPPRESQDRILDGLVRLFYEARQHSQSLKRRYGVTAAQLSLLKILEKLGEQTHSELSEKLYLRGSTTTGIIDRLERRGLVKRRRSRSDRRLVRIELADAGRRLLAGVPRGQSKFGALRRFVAGLPHAEADSFAATLEKIVAFMSQGSEPTPQGSVARGRDAADDEEKDAS